MKLLFILGGLATILYMNNASPSSALDFLPATDEEKDLATEAKANADSDNALTDDHTVALEATDAQHQDEHKSLDTIENQYEQKLTDLKDRITNDAKELIDNAKAEFKDLDDLDINLDLLSSGYQYLTDARDLKSDSDESIADIHESYQTTLENNDHNPDKADHIKDDYQEAQRNKLQDLATQAIDTLFQE